MQLVERPLRSVQRDEQPVRNRPGGPGGRAVERRLFPVAHRRRARPRVRYGHVLGHRRHVPGHHHDDHHHDHDRAPHDQHAGHDHHHDQHADHDQHDRGGAVDIHDAASRDLRAPHRHAGELPTSQGHTVHPCDVPRRHLRRPRSAPPGRRAAGPRRLGRAGLLHDPGGGLAEALPAHLRLLRPEPHALPADQMLELRGAEERAASHDHHRRRGASRQPAAVAARHHGERGRPMRGGTTHPATEGRGPGGVPMTRLLGILAVLLALVGPAGAQGLRHVFRTAPALVGLPGLATSGPYQNAADMILEQAIRNLPLYPAASSAYTFRWDATQGILVRADDTVSAWPYTERGQTLGEGLLNVGVTWGYFDVDSVDGQDLGHDPFPVSVCCGSKIRYQALTDLLYTVGTFNITYGLLDDLDLNIAIPIVTLDMGLDVTRQDIPGGPVRRATVTDQNAGNISDMLLRAKYRVFETSGDLGSAVGAGGVRVRLPSGNARQGLGTGYGEIGPYVALTTSLAGGWVDSD